MKDLCLINLLTSFSVSFFYTTPRPLSPPVPDSSPAKLYTEEGKAAVSGCAGRFVGTIGYHSSFAAFWFWIWISQKAMISEDCFHDLLGTKLELAWYCERRIVPKDMWDRAILRCTKDFRSWVARNWNGFVEMYQRRNQSKRFFHLRSGACLGHVFNVSSSSEEKHNLSRTAMNPIHESWVTYF